MQIKAFTNVNLYRFTSNYKHRGFSMKEVTITQELIDTYPYKSGKWHPHRPFCRLCASLKPFIKHTSIGGTVNLWRPEMLRIGEKAITVTFRNGTLAYYHVKCWNDPNYAMKVESIKKQEKSLINPIV